MWLAAQQPTAQAHAAIVHKSPTSAHIKEIIETHIFQVVAPSAEAPEPESELQDIFEVFVAEKRRQEKVTKPLEPAEPVSTLPLPANTNTHA